MEFALVCTVLTCSAAACCQEEEEKRRKREKIWTRKFVLDRNKYGGHVVTIKALRENDSHSFRRYLRMSNDVFEGRMVTRSE